MWEEQTFQEGLVSWTVKMWDGGRDVLSNSFNVNLTIKSERILLGVLLVWTTLRS